MTPKPFHHGLLPYRFGNLRDAIWRWKRRSVCGHSTAKTETKNGTNSHSNHGNNMANSGCTHQLSKTSVTKIICQTASAIVAKTVALFSLRRCFHPSVDSGQKTFWWACLLVGDDSNVQPATALLEANAAERSRTGSWARRNAVYDGGWRALAPVTKSQIMKPTGELV